MNDLDTQIAALEPPFSKDQMKEDIGTVLLTTARMARWLFHREDGSTPSALLQLIGVPAGTEQPDIEWPDVNWSNGGFRYEWISTTALARDMDTLFDLAYGGKIDTDVDDLDSESMPSWTSRILMDLRQSEFVAEWNGYSRCQESIERCLQVYETAHARLVLERIRADDRFMDWYGPNTEGLSIRQMALLSGMTEASLRTLANPKRKNALKTQSDGKNTFVAIEDAKDWLISKARYVPIKYTSRSGRLDITNRRFDSANELLFALRQRARYLLSEGDAATVRSRIAAASDRALPADDGAVLQIEEHQLEDTELMSKLGEALQLPGPLLALRCAEACARDRLRTLERQIQQLAA